MLAVCGDYMPPLHIKDPTAADILPWLIDAMTNTVDVATDYWIDGWSFVWEGKAVGRVLPAQESYDEAHQQNTQPLHYLPAGTNILALLFGSSNFSRLHNTPSYLVFYGYDKTKNRQSIWKINWQIADSWCVLMFNEWTCRPTQCQFAQATAADG